MTHRTEQLVSTVALLIMSLAIIGLGDHFNSDFLLVAGAWALGFVSALLFITSLEKMNNKS